MLYRFFFFKPWLKFNLRFTLKIKTNMIIVSFMRKFASEALRQKIPHFLQENCLLIIQIFYRIKIFIIREFCNEKCPKELLALNFHHFLQEKIFRVFTFTLKENITCDFEQIFGRKIPKNILRF